MLLFMKENLTCVEPNHIIISDVKGRHNFFFCVGLCFRGFLVQPVTLHAAHCERCAKNKKNIKMEI